MGTLKIIQQVLCFDVPVSGVHVPYMAQVTCRTTKYSAGAGVHVPYMAQVTCRIALAVHLRISSLINTDSCGLKLPVNKGSPAITWCGA